MARLVVTRVATHRFARSEPTIGMGDIAGVPPLLLMGEMVTVTGDWFRFQDPDGGHNAEALVVHPNIGAIHVITKEKSGRSGVYTS